MAIGPMSEAERYRFDLQGFLVRRGVLGAGELAALHAAIDVLDLPRPGADLGQPALQRPPADRPPLPRPHRPRRRAGDRPRGLRSERPPRPRLRHRHVARARAGSACTAAARRSTRRSTTSSTAAGSAPASSPPSGRSSTTRRTPAGSCASRAATSPASGCRRRSTATSPCRCRMAAGDVVVFSEALTHGTLPWQSARGAPHARLQVLAGQLGVVARRVAARAAGRVHRPPAPAAAAAERRPPPSVVP